ncbi:MAG: hypothetical protein R2873_15890 [Caldilineaceae bacterium]
MAGSDPRRHAVAEQRQYAVQRRRMRWQRPRGKMEGGDSLALFAHDLEWTDKPGKPFDAAVYQQVAVTNGAAYSLSAWMLSLRR